MTLGQRMLLAIAKEHIEQSNTSGALDILSAILKGDGGPSSDITVYIRKDQGEIILGTSEEGIQGKYFGPMVANSSRCEEEYEVVRMASPISIQIQPQIVIG
jgi:hypothetical protein